VGVPADTEKNSAEREGIVIDVRADCPRTNKVRGVFRRRGLRDQKRKERGLVSVDGKPVI